VIWQRSCLYRVWVIGGLLAVVALVVYVGINTKPGDPPPYPVFGIALAVYLGGIIVMQGVDLVRRKPGQVAPVPEGRLPLTHEELMATLALPGSDAARSQAGAEGARRFSIGLFIPTALIAILLPLGGYLYVSGAVTGVWQPLGETGPGIPVAAIPGLVLVLVLLVLLPRNLRRARQLTDDYNSALGLGIVATPSVILLPRIGTDGIAAHTVGPTSFEGDRHGRHVVVDAYAGSTAVLVQKPVDAFEVNGDGGMLRIEAGPAWLAQALADVPADDRWRRMRMRGSGQGIQVDRKGSAVDSEWLLDLWLAEHVASAAPR
jgi:hypothetical protein